ncbi:hypothetical protein KDK_49710 [Dictyobacter kobayashii]|uniref:Uncharacterized protein n=1 Tax=Dictyobacter kobayashii TaxID=2014872 RepID=A0A402APR5_9CHLR|nr:hypothetical protein KDK_49710 [Dictyobacter kobayashii]
MHKRSDRRDGTRKQEARHKETHTGQQPAARPKTLGWLRLYDRAPVMRPVTFIGTRRRITIFIVIESRGFNIKGVSST